MTADTFGTLYTRIEREVLKQTATVYLTDVKAAIVSAVRYFEHKPVWFTEVVGSNLTITAGSDNVALPANFAAMKDLRVSDGTRLYGKGYGFEFAEWNDFRRLQAENPNYTGTPRHWSILNTTLYVDSTVASNTTLPNDYHKKDTAYPSASGDTSIWFDEGVDVIRYMAKSIFYGDRMHDEENEAKYFTKAEAWFDNLAGRTSARMTKTRRLA